MIRKLSVVIICLIVFALPVYSQSKTSTEHYSELLQNHRSYQILLDPFYAQKSRHLAHGTVSTQAELLVAVRNLIGSEIKTILSYVNFVKIYLSEASLVLDLGKNNFVAQLDSKIEFLNNAESRAKNLASLGDSQTLLKETSNHYKDLTEISYQIQSIVQYESTKKIYSNLKIEREKLEACLSKDTSESYQILAAKEKFQVLNQEMDLIEKKLGEIELKLEPEENRVVKWESVYSDVNKRVKEIVLSLNKIINGYQNIIFSLK